MCGVSLPYCDSLHLDLPRSFTGSLQRFTGTVCSVLFVVFQRLTLALFHFFTTTSLLRGQRPPDMQFLACVLRVERINRFGLGSVFFDLGVLCSALTKFLSRNIVLFTLPSTRSSRHRVSLVFVTSGFRYVVGFCLV